MNPLISATELSTRLPQADQLNELNELNQLALFDCRHDLMNPALGQGCLCTRTHSRCTVCVFG
ncbi:MAG: hypothetical protein RLZZ502_236 [Pseudomonadota bacterium]|jgi:hypothetical protein